MGVRRTCGECGGPIQIVERTVVASPAERNWPHDVKLRVPYCPRCKNLLDYEHVKTEVTA